MKQLRIQAPMASGDLLLQREVLVDLHDEGGGPAPAHEALATPAGIGSVNGGLFGDPAQTRAWLAAGLASAKSGLRAPGGVDPW